MTLAQLFKELATMRREWPDADAYKVVVVCSHDDVEIHGVHYASGAVRLTPRLPIAVNRARQT